jgi:hypothetical protein
MSKLNPNAGEFVPRCVPLARSHASPSDCGPMQTLTVVLDTSHAQLLGASGCGSPRSVAVCRGGQERRDYAGRAVAEQNGGDSLVTNRWSSA